MSTIDQPVQVTLSLPRNLYERAEQAAIEERRPVAELLSALIAESMDAHESVRTLLERVSASYHDRLAREGKLGQSSDAVLDELRSLREQVARELYP
jgi:hypothetical protein